MAQNQGDLRNVLTQLAAIQTALTITDPLTLQIKAAYKYPPNRVVALPDTPCWMNSWNLQRIDRPVAGGLVRHYYEIRMQLFVQDADLNRAADIASAFHVQYVRALNANISLGGSVRTSDLRGGSPTLSMLEWSGNPYVGLDLILDVMYDEVVSFS